jgi:hypothetical protein
VAASRAVAWAAIGRNALGAVAAKALQAPLDTIGRPQSVPQPGEEPGLAWGADLQATPVPCMLPSISLVGLLIVIVCSPMVGSTCSMDNRYDTVMGPSADGCAVVANKPVYRGGAGDCEFELGKGGRYAGYCNLYCNHNKYDVTPNLAGSSGQVIPSCAALLAIGYGCTTHFGSGQQLGVGGVIQTGMTPNTHGLCDFECGFCPPTYTHRQDDCWVSDKYDNVNGLGSCAALLAAGTYSCNTHFHSGGSLAGHCNLACELNLLEHPAAYIAAGATQAQIDAIVGVLAPSVGLSVTAFKARMLPGTSSARGLCQVLIEAYANSGVDSCNLYLAQRKLVHGLPYGMCDFACGFCQATDGLQYAANTTVFAVATPDCLTPGDCCSVANASDYTGDGASCAVSLAAGIECGHLFAPDRAFSGQCDLACGYCLPSGDPCANINCGAHGNCTSVNGIGTCMCDIGWLGGSCQFTTAQCTASSSAYNSSNSSCCLTMSHPIHLQTTIRQLMTAGEDFWDYENGNGTCASQLAAGHTCAEFMAPGRPFEARCDFTCGFCAPMDMCQFISCGLHGTCQGGSCVCDPGYIGGTCQHTETQCTSTQDCCSLSRWNSTNPDVIAGADWQSDAFVALLFGKGFDVMDVFHAQGFFSTHCGHQAFNLQMGAAQSTLRPVENFQGSVISCVDIVSPTVLPEVNRSIAKIAAITPHRAWTWYAATDTSPSPTPR